MTKNLKGERSETGIRAQIVHLPSQMGIINLIVGRIVFGHVQETIQRFSGVLNGCRGS